MALFPLRKRTYIALFVVPLLLPFFVAIAKFAIDGSRLESIRDALLVLPPLLCLMALTYPLGMVITAISFVVVVVLAWLPPFGGVMFAIPFYLIAGYVQWYLLVPRYFDTKKA
jgi:hypothetical protein